MRGWWCCILLSVVLPSLIPIFLSFLEFFLGAAFLASRSWSGLEPQLGQTQVQDTIVQGLSGIAMGYATEPGIEKCEQLTAASQGGYCQSAGGGRCCQQRGDAQPEQ